MNKFILIILSVFLYSITAQSTRSQDNNPKNIFPLDKNKKKQETPVRNLPSKITNSTGPLTKTRENKMSVRKQELISEMEKIKSPDNPLNQGDRLLDLQKEIEKEDGSTITRNEELSRSFIKIVPSPPQTEVLKTTPVYERGMYHAAIATQVEQRGTTAGRIWIAVGYTDTDTGVTAKPDTIALYYSDNGGNSFDEYVRVAFSSANKLGFDDLDMEIIENTSGDKYIYMVFGYYTDGYFGSRRIGYTVVRTPSLAVFGSTLFFPGQTASSKYLNPRITSDNARYPSNPYVSISVMQDSASGTDHFWMTKICKIFSPFTLAPAVTYNSKCIYNVAEGFAYDNVTTDVAYFNNGGDSLIYVLSGYPGYTPYLYFYKVNANTAEYPVYSGIFNSTGDDLEYARIACSGGTNQLRMMVTYTDNYQNTGDFDQWYLTSSDAGAGWLSNTIEYTGLHDSRYGDIIARRNANGSFAVSLRNDLGTLYNVTAATFNGEFNIASYQHAMNTDYANSFASPKPAFRYVNGDSCLTMWSYYYTSYGTSGCDVANFYLMAGTEGYYDEVAGVNTALDHFTVYLAEPTAPYNYVDTAGAYMEYSMLMNELAFRNVIDGYYYVVLKHFNGLETWSSEPVYVTRMNTTGYNFTDAQSRAFGNNLMLKGDKWLIYSGDLNQDGVINLTDLVIACNDATDFEIGEYRISDVNGDLVVNLQDIMIVYNNTLNFVHIIRP